MKKIIYILFAMLALLLANPVGAADEVQVSHHFEGMREVELDLVTGDCQLQKSADDQIHLNVTHSYAEGMFDIDISQRAGKLKIEEKLWGSDSRGKALWQLALPDDIELEFASATGDLNASGVTLELEASSGTGSLIITESRGEYDLNSGTGRVEVAQSRGEFELNSGTGKVIVENCQGDFEANSGTGDVEGLRLEIQSAADFNSGTGEALVKEPRGKDFELTVSSGTNQATLDLDGAPVQGYFEFSCHAFSGRIVCPVAFDQEDTCDHEHSPKLRKWFTRGKEIPRYYISTGTGRAVLKR